MKKNRVKYNKFYMAGCGGMLGEAFYKIFNNDYELRCTDIDVNENWLSFLDFRDFDKYKNEVLSFKPDYLFHLGAFTDLEFCELNIDETYETNFIAVQHAVRLANHLNIPILYISTAGIFNGKKESYNEMDTPDPIGHYAKSKYKGSKNKPTILKSDKKWLASIHGNNNFGIIIDFHCDWVIIDGLEISRSKLSGINVRADNISIRNCWIHSNMHGIVIANRINCNVENNLVEFNGINLQHHHGIAASGNNLVFQNNIIRHNASYGLHLFPKIANFTIRNNLVHGHSSGRGIILNLSHKLSTSVITNNTIIEDQTSIEILSRTNNDIISNNILLITNNVFISKNISISDVLNNVKMDYNCIYPKLKKRGPNCINPNIKRIREGWIDPDRGIFLLNKNSPLINSGIPNLNNKNNFWDLKRNDDDYKIDIGAFSFLPENQTKHLLHKFSSNWPYYEIIGYDPLNKIHYYPNFWNLINPE